MATPALSTFYVKDASEHRDDILRTYKNGLIQRGVSNPNVRPDTETYAFAQAVGNELAVCGANCVVKADELMPDTAIGDALQRWCTPLGLTKQAAAGSVGGVVIVTSVTTTIAAGTVLLDDAALQYEVSIGGTFSNGDTVAIRAISTGIETNHAEGDVLRWQNAPPFTDEKVTVAAGGLVNGIDAEDDEALRERLFAYLQNPPKSGNVEHVAEIAEASSPSVQKAFVYPAVQGPATIRIAVAAAPTATNKSRELAAATLSGTVVPFITGQLPEHSYLTITTVDDLNGDVAFALGLPESRTASPPGPGGGWIDGTPWPSPDGVSTFRCTVTAVTSTTEFEVDAVAAPVAGVSHIAWLSPYDWTLYRAVVSSFTGSSGAYTITIDTPFPSIAIGCYIWPDCEEAQTYVDAVLDAFAYLGPGEVTPNSAALQRGFRHPRPATSWPYNIGNDMLRQLTNSSDLVEAAAFYHRTNGTTTITGASPALGPIVDAFDPTLPPTIYVPRHIAFYRNAG